MPYSDQCYSRPIRVTASGVALSRDTRLAGYSILTGSNDLSINFRDGGSAGAILWSVEADAAASSPQMNFGSYPLRFPNGIYVEFSQADGDGAFSLAVVEPYTAP